MKKNPEKSKINEFASQIAGIFPKKILKDKFK
jgi:hypothetical protein